MVFVFPKRGCDGALGNVENPPGPDVLPRISDVAGNKESENLNPLGVVLLGGFCVLNIIGAEKMGAPKGTDA